MNRKYLGYLFEIAWILPSVAVPIAFLVAIVITAFAVGIAVPGNAGRTGDTCRLESDVHCHQS